jgi:hypothetical protein
MLRAALLLAVALVASSLPAAAAGGPPACFASPLPKLVTVKTGNPDRECQVLEKVLESSATPDMAWVPGAIVNAVLKLTEGGFATDTYVLQFHVTAGFTAVFTVGRDQLVRLSSSDAAARTGAWWVPKDYVTDTAGNWLSSDTIAETLALPQGSQLKVVAYAGAIDPGTLGYVGIVAPAFNHKGGGIQFWFPRAPVFTKDTSEPVGTAQ